MMFSFFKCRVLLMGIKPATNISQSSMVSVFQPMAVNKSHSCIDSIFHCEGTYLTVISTSWMKSSNNWTKPGCKSAWKKNDCYAKQVELLWFCLRQMVFQPIWKQVKVILTIAHPHNVKRVQRFLGTIIFIKNQIPNHAEIMDPITMLTKKDQPFVWEEEQQHAFDKTKAAMANLSSALTPTQTTVSLYIWCNATTCKRSNVGARNWQCWTHY